MTASELITLYEAAEQLDVHYMTVYRYVRTGQLPAVKVGSEWRIDPDDLARFGDERPLDSPKAGRSRADHHRRLEDRLLAGDEPGAWNVVQSALGGGLEPEVLYLDVIAPALVSIGKGWAKGTVTVAQEHQASVVVLRLIGRLGPLFTRRGRKRGTVVLGAPPGDRHAVPLALLADLLRGQSFGVIDLGADTPAFSFADAVARADRLLAVGISATTPGNEESIRNAITALRGVTDAPIVLGGSAVTNRVLAQHLGADHWTATARDALDTFDDLAAAAGRARRRASRQTGTDDGA